MVFVFHSSASSIGNAVLIRLHRMFPQQNAMGFSEYKATRQLCVSSDHFRRFRAQFWEGSRRIWGKVPELLGKGPVRVQSSINSGNDSNFVPNKISLLGISLEPLNQTFAFLESEDSDLAKAASSGIGDWGVGLVCFTSLHATGYLQQIL